MAHEPVLIVDDNPSNVKLARVLLTNAGFDVRTASDSREALETLASFSPRLILMDIQLPGMDGLKFTPAKGKITVRVVAEADRWFRLEVEDTGIGIAPKDQQLLFQGFHQLDTSLSKQFQGAGLGLALTKRIVEAQGGRVGVESQLGVGSVFFALLPRGKPS